ncbi:unnamed protein product, partial [Symbiodinium natans]
MGCGGSCCSKSTPPKRTSSFHMRKLPKVVPEGMVLQPDRQLHDAYVKDLNRFLRKVQKHPLTFTNYVETARSDGFDSIGVDEDSSEVTQRRCQPESNAK